MNNLEISSDNNIKESLEWHVSANILCNYMKKPEYLRMALKNLALYPRYYEERLEYLNIPALPTATFPMLCFCDIPLSKVGEHMDFYGHYGIALKKNSCIARDVQPISYINRRARLCQDISEAFNSLYSIDEVLEDKWSFLPDVLMSQLLYTKPIDGYMLKDEELVYRLFQDECEWRYIPTDLGGLELILQQKYNTEKGRRSYSDTLNKHENSWFKFQLEDIEYIIVPDEIQAQKLMGYIARMRTFRDQGKWKMQDKRYLISKIEVADKFTKNLI